MAYRFRIVFKSFHLFYRLRIVTVQKFADTDRLRVNRRPIRKDFFPDRYDFVPIVFTSSSCKRGLRANGQTDWSYWFCFITFSKRSKYFATLSRSLFSNFGTSNFGRVFLDDLPSSLCSRGAATWAWFSKRSLSIANSCSRTLCFSCSWASRALCFFQFYFCFTSSSSFLSFCFTSSRFCMRSPCFSGTLPFFPLNSLLLCDKVTQIFSGQVQRLAKFDQLLQTGGSAFRIVIISLRCS